MKKKVEGSEVVTRSVVGLLGLVLFLNLFFAKPVGATGFSLIVLGGWIWAWQTFDQNKQWSITGTAVLVILALLQLVTGTEKLFMLLGSLMIIGVTSLYTWVKGVSPGGILESVLTPWWLVLEYWRGVRRVIASFWTGSWVEAAKNKVKLDESKSATARAVVTGIVVGVPIVAWLVSLLTHADPVFAKFVQGIVSEEILKELPARLTWSTTLLVILSPLLKIGWRGYRSPLSFLARGWGREMSVVLIMVVIVLASFLVVQWPYVFVQVAKETDLSAYGVATYSEYVKRGFADLLQVAGLVFGIAWASLLVTKGEKNKVRTYLLGLQGLMGIEFAIFVISIFRRVWLYQSLHGLTLARLYGLSLLVAIVGLTFTMMGRYWRSSLRWVKIEAVWLAILVVGVMGLNLENWIVKRPPTVNNRVDYVYLSRLSEDGYSGWIKALDWSESELSTLVAAKLSGIGVDQRRTTYYSSLVLQRMAENYDRLIWQYGSEQEIKAYVTQILDWEEKMLNQYPELATSRISGGREQVLREINEARKTLDGKDWGKVGLVIMSGSRVRMPGNYVFSGYDEGYYGLYSGGLENSKRLSSWDRTLKYSYKEARTWQQFKSDVPINRLLAIMEDYWRLRLQIRTQPETERMVEVDISFDSPWMR